MANEIGANQSLIKRGNGASPEVFTAVTGVFNIDPPKPKRAEIDVSDLTDTARRKKLGMVDNGSLSIQMNWIDGDAQQDGLVTDYAAGTLRNFQLTYPSAAGTPSAGGTDSFAAFVMSVDRGPVALDGKQTRTATLLISGAIVET